MDTLNKSKEFKPKDSKENVRPLKDLPETEPLTVSETDDDDFQSEVDTPYQKKRFKGSPLKDQSQQRMIESLNGQIQNLQSIIQSGQGDNSVKKLQFSNQELQVQKNQQEMLWEAVRSGDIMCSEQTQFENKRIPDKDRSLKQAMQVQVFESIDKWKSETENMRKELQNQKENLLLSTEQVERLSAENESIKRTTKSSKEDTVVRLSEQEKRERELTGRLSELEVHLGECKSKELAQDKINDKLTQTEVKLKETMAQKEVAEATCKASQQEKTDSVDKYGQAQKQVDLLTNDKTHLKRANEDLEAKNNRLSEDVSRLEQKIDDLKTAKKKLKSKITECDENLKTKNLEEHFNKELDVLRRKSDEDMQRFKREREEVHTREVRGLIDQLDNVKESQEKITNKMSDRENAQDNLMQEHRTLRAKLESESTELRGDLKLKMFELERMSLLQEETMQSSKDLRGERAMLDDKLRVIREEQARMESESTKQLSGAKAELAVSKEQLASQSKLEDELDNVVMKGEAGAFLGSIPTRQARRLEQAMGLANSLSSKTALADKLQREVDELKKKISKVESEKEAIRRTDKAAEKGQGFLAKSLEAKEVECMEMKESHSRLVDELASLRSHCQSLQEEKKEMQRDFEELRSKRKVVDMIQSKLENMLKPVQKQTKELDKAEAKKGKGLGEKGGRKMI